MAFVAGQKLRASQLSTYVCTSSTRPAGHSGQIIYETDTGLLAVYTGSAWAYFAATGEIASDAKFQGSGTQSVATSSDVPVSFGSTVLSSAYVTRGTTGAGHYFRINRPGRYIITATCRYQPDAAGGERYIGLLRSGTAVYAAAGVPKPSATNGPTTLVVATIARVTSAEAGTPAADFHVAAWQSSGGSLTLDGTAGWRTIYFTWLGA